MVTRYIQVRWVFLPCHTLKSPHPRRGILGPGYFPGDPFPRGMAWVGHGVHGAALGPSPRGLLASSCLEPLPWAWSELELCRTLTYTIREPEQLGLQDPCPEVGLLPRQEDRPGVGRVCLELHVAPELGWGSAEHSITHR